VPDIMTNAKGTRNARRSLTVRLRRGPTLPFKGLTTSLTFGGNPVTRTQATAVIDFIDEQDLLTNCTETGGTSVAVWKTQG